MRFLGQLAVAALAGAIIAWVGTGFVVQFLFAAGGYTSEALVELSPRAFGVIGGAGALVSVSLVLLAGQSPLPSWVRPVALGSLAGVAAVMVPTVFVACALGGPGSKGQAPYLYVGQVFGLPIGLVGGAVAGLLVAKRRQADQAGPGDKPRD